MAKNRRTWRYEIDKTTRYRPWTIFGIWRACDANEAALTGELYADTTMVYCNGQPYRHRWQDSGAAYSCAL